MPNSIISEGKTTNEAIENGLKQLHVTKNQVDVKVLESEDKRSFFSILAPRVVKVELTLKENKNEEKVEVSSKPREIRKYTEQELNTAEANARNFLDEFLKCFGRFYLDGIYNTTIMDYNNHFQLINYQFHEK